jgi:hypothetical protein
MLGKVSSHRPPVISGSRLYTLESMTPKFRRDHEEGAFTIGNDHHVKHSLQPVMWGLLAY